MFTDDPAIETHRSSSGRRGADRCCVRIIGARVRNVRIRNYIVRTFSTISRTKQTRASSSRGAFVRDNITGDDGVARKRRPEVFSGLCSFYKRGWSVQRDAFGITRVSVTCI